MFCKVNAHFPLTRLTPLLHAICNTSLFRSAHSPPILRYANLSLMGSLRGPYIGLDQTSALSTCLTLPPTSAPICDANTLTCSKGFGPNHPRLCPPSGLEPVLGVGGEPCPHPEWSVTGMAMAWGSQGKTRNAQRGAAFLGPTSTPKPVGIGGEIGPPDKYVCLTTRSSSPSVKQSRAYPTPIIYRL